MCCKQLCLWSPQTSEGAVWYWTPKLQTCLRLLSQPKKSDCILTLRRENVKHFVIESARALLLLGSTFLGCISL
jgi:hypothetical protein